MDTAERVRDDEVEVVDQLPPVEHRSRVVGPHERDLQRNRFERASVPDLDRERPALSGRAQTDRSRQVVLVMKPEVAMVALEVQSLVGLDTSPALSVRRPRSAASVVRVQTGHALAAVDEKRLEKGGARWRRREPIPGGRFPVRVVAVPQVLAHEQRHAMSRRRRHARPAQLLRAARALVQGREKTVAGGPDGGRHPVSSSRRTARRNGTMAGELGHVVGVLITVLGRADRDDVLGRSRVSDRQRDGTVVSCRVEDEEVRVRPHERIDLARLSVVRGVGGTPGIGMRPRFGGGLVETVAVGIVCGAEQGVVVVRRRAHRDPTPDVEVLEEDLRGVGLPIEG